MVWDEFATATCSVAGDVGDKVMLVTFVMMMIFQCIFYNISHQHLELITKIFRPQLNWQQGGVTIFEKSRKAICSFKTKMTLFSSFYPDVWRLDWSLRYAQSQSPVRLRPLSRFDIRKSFVQAKVKNCLLRTASCGIEIVWMNLLKESRSRN